MSERNTEAALLDAVRDSVLAVGVRRTTFADVARRAEVSRATAYRHFADIGTAVAELMTREFSALIVEARAEVGEREPARERVVEMIVRIAERLPEHPLFRRVVDVDPELLLPYVVDRRGSTQRVGAEMIAAALAEGHADGSVRPLDDELAAYCIQLVVQSFVLAAGITRAHFKPADVTGELRWLLDSYLRPPPVGDASSVGAARG